jgi:hypothetical protein
MLWEKNDLGLAKFSIKLIEKLTRLTIKHNINHLSKKLWLPTETGYVGSHGNTSTGCLNSTFKYIFLINFSSTIECFLTSVTSSF